MRASQFYPVNVVYQESTTTPNTLSGLVFGTNIIGVTAPAGAVTINIPAGTDPTKIVRVADERDTPDQGTITVVAL